MLAGSGRGKHRRLVRLRQNSPLRSMDARVKVALTLLISAASMLPLPRLLIFAAGFVAFMAYARLLSEIAYQVRRLAWSWWYHHRRSSLPRPLRRNSAGHC